MKIQQFELIKKICKKKTPQRVSFYMRKELIKFDRYQKQFHFLIDKDIETVEQLQTFKGNAENKISKLTLKRSMLYSNPETKSAIEEINNELRELRKDVRTCNNILENTERIREHTNYVSLLEQEANNKNIIKSRNVCK